MLRSLAVVATIASFSPAFAGGVDELPKNIQDELYNKDMMDPMQPLAESAYRDWKPKKGPPWTIGYASSYAGNTWRADVMKRLQEELIPKWKKLGLVKDVIITQSNLNDSTYAFGHGHQGLIGGAVTGKIVSQLAAGLPTAIDLAPFRTDRF